MKRLLIVLSALLIACGGDATGPGAGDKLAGTWDGLSAGGASVHLVLIREGIYNANGAGQVGGTIYGNISASGTATCCDVTIALIGTPLVVIRGVFETDRRIRGTISIGGSADVALTLTKS